MATDMEHTPKAHGGVVAPEKARFWTKRRAETLQSRSSIEETRRNSSEANPKRHSMKMAVPVGILVCLVIVSMGLTTYAIASDATLENVSNDMEKNNADIQARSDYPDLDDLSSFFDFEIGPPSITYQHLEDTDSKNTYSLRPETNKNYYYYNSEGHPKYRKYHYHHTVPTRKQVVTPGTHYKSSTQKTFIEDDTPVNESKTVLNQAKVGQYQVSIVDANSPVLSNLGLTPEDLERLSNYNKRDSNNGTMIASDSTATATYAENPRSNHPQSGPSNSNNAPSYPPRYDSSNHSPTNYGERSYKPHDHHHPSGASASQDSYSHPSASAHPPPQGSYDSKSYRAIQGSSPQTTNNYNYPAAPYSHQPPPPASYSNSPPSPASYSNPPPASYNNPPPASYNNPPPASYNNHPASYSNPPPQSSYNNPPPQSSYNNPPPQSSYNNPPRPTSYSPQRSSGEPWRQSSQVHTDWDDKQAKHQDSWQSSNYPPHPPPLPYGGNSGSSGSYYSKPTYGATSDKNGHRLAPSYAKPESTSKATYSGSSAVSSGSTEYSSHKPSYYPSSGYSSSKVPSRTGSVSYAASSHHEHPAPASKPGITIRFKAKAPSHGGGGHGLSIPLSFSPLDVVKKLIPSLNPLNNKKVTIGITIENKKEPHHEYHSY